MSSCSRSTATRSPTAPTTALPKSIRLNAVVGFTNMLLRLWEAESPAAVLVAWDTLSTPTYRHEAFAPYQSGRVFEESILEQLDILPDAVASLGFAVAKAPGFEADDFLAAAARAWPGEVLVATSDRDAYQLASDRVTILQPAKGVSELGADRAGRGARALRRRAGAGARPDRAPRRPVRQAPGRARHRAEEGGGDPARARRRWRRRSPPDDFAAEAEELRLYRRIATMDASAPLPPLEEQTPTWAEASSFYERLGLGNLAGRVRSAWRRIAADGRVAQPPGRRARTRGRRAPRAARAVAGRDRRAARRGRARGPRERRPHQRSAPLLPARPSRTAARKGLDELVEIVRSTS